eukprot:GGOE01001487.1.p1 GENE.GGOE01001487.1~~GGOE01001487.1.p1  ORF type:complete len:598 (-),score=119.35 GGOE01001487.1:249-2012(-)
MKEHQVPSEATSSTQNGAIDGETFGNAHCPEIVRLILQALQTFGYRESFRKLEDESGIMLQSQAINQFRNAIFTGDWDQAISLLPVLKVEESSSKHVEFLIHQQRFLELLEEGDRRQALNCIRTQLSPIAQDNAQLHRLSGLLMCKDTKTLYKRAAWDGKCGNSRSMLIRSLHTYISSDELLQEGRLFHLLQQAQQHQQQQCLFHNTLVSDFSLLQDHACTRDIVPQHTRCVLKHHNDEVWFVAFSNNGQYLATAGKDQRCFIFETQAWLRPPAQGTSEAAQPFRMLQGHTDAISFLAWSPDDTRLVTCSQDCHCRVWNVQTGDCILTFKGHNEAVNAAVWYPDGQHVVSAALDKFIYKWDMAGKVKGKHCGARVNDIAISKDCRRMVTIDSDKRIVNFNLLHPLDRLPEHEPMRGYSNSARERHDDSDDGEGGSEEEDVEVRNATMHGVYKTIHKSTDSLTSLCLSDDGHYILVNKAIGEKKGCIHLYDIRQRPFKVIQKFTGHLQRRFVIRSCFGGANQTFVLSGSEDNRVYVYHRSSGRKLFALPGHQNVVNTVSWNPAVHTMFASGSDDGSVRVWTTHPQGQE